MTSYEIPYNMCASGLDKCELLWTYDGSNFSKDMKLDISKYSLLLIYTGHDSTNNDTSNQRAVFILVNDPTTAYKYRITTPGQTLETGNRQVTITNDGLTFSSLYNGMSVASSTNSTICIPYQIYGIR